MGTGLAAPAVAVEAPAAEAAAAEAAAAEAVEAVEAAVVADWQRCERSPFPVYRGSIRKN